LQVAQRGAPLAAWGTRFFLPQDGQGTTLLATTQG
jgi:hypothetical protein